MNPTPSDPARSRRGRRRLLWTGLMLLGFLGAAELVVRFAVPPGRLLRIEQLDNALQSDYRSQFLQTIVDDAETFWRFAPDLEVPPGNGPFFGRVANDQSLREREHIVIPKPAGELRILFLGDSCTYGYGLDDRHTFVAFTEAKLRARFPNRRLECINAGVPGYSLFQCYRRLLHQGLGLEPDLVVVQSGWNERIQWDGRGDQEHYEMLLACRPPGVLAASRLCQLLWTWANWAEPGKQKRDRVTPEEFRALLGEMEAATRAQGGELLSLLTGSRGNLSTGRPTTLQTEQVEFARKRRFGPGGKAAFVDGVSILSKAVRRDGKPVASMLLDNAHPTLAYNELLAAALVERIAPWIEAK